MTRWQFLRKHWVMSSIGAAILLAALVTVIYAVATGEGDEGFQKVDGKRLTWSKHAIPISCMYEESVDEQQHDMDQARDQISERVGNILGICSPWMLKKPFPTKPPRGTILLRLGKPEPKDGVLVVTPWDGKHGGTTEFYKDSATGKLVGAVIYIDRAVPKKLRVSAWLHEFMHAFGLKHDRKKGSLMYYGLSSRSQKLSARDVGRLQREYLR